MTADFSHQILIDGADLDRCRQRVLYFFHENLLLRYAQVEINKRHSLPASFPEFWPRLESAIKTNRETLAGLLDELQQEGFDQLSNLNTMEQGYQSKLLHTVAHLVDGFIGIDSYFYNLVEDSNRLSDNLRREIEKRPEEFWLLKVECRDTAGKADQLANLRGMGKSD